MTNYDMLRAKSRREFGEFICWCLDHIPCDLVGEACNDKACGDRECRERVMEWLEKEI